MRNGTEKGNKGNRTGQGREDEGRMEGGSRSHLHHIICLNDALNL
jgi:hypothetical protein